MAGHGSLARAEALHRRTARDAPGGARHALHPFLLDLAASSGLSPLSASEAADLADAGHQRAVRHAAWRYLHDLPNGRGHLPAASTASDAYERMLLAPPDPCIEWDSRRSGPVIAQTMLLGGLDTPGQGLSGGLSVLLAGLGDQLAVTAGTGGVVTVVLAGHADFERNPDVSYERSPGHWILRLPVDAADPPPQTDMHAHRPALAWWAARLLGSMSRPLDVLHVRYADDGSLALAESAARLGARLVFTATPDPHRQLADAYAHTTPDTVDALRYDLHRVFVADRLVERADTVVAIPGRGGTGELVRHFPGLADVNEGMGPAAPRKASPPTAPLPTRSTDRANCCPRSSAEATTRTPWTRPTAICRFSCVWGASTRSSSRISSFRSGSPPACPSGAPLCSSAAAPGARPEAEVRGRIATLLASHPQARSRFALIPAMANEDVRRLERALADPDRAARCWYVCPSAKEEFGIAVLEAMEAACRWPGRCAGESRTTCGTV